MNNYSVIMDHEIFQTPFWFSIKFQFSKEYSTNVIRNRLEIRRLM